jgi:hypothetical protein
MMKSDGHSAVCDSLQPMNYSLPDSCVHGILQARILAWAANPSPGDLPDPGMKSESPALQADSLPSEPSESHMAKHKDLTFKIELIIPKILFIIRQYYSI